MKVDVEQLFLIFKKRFAIPNLIILIGILFLLGKILLVWLSSFQEPEIQLADINPAKESGFVLKRKNISLSDYEVIPKKNLFRESRMEWVPPPSAPPPPPKLPSAKPTPPPEIIVSGIIRGGELSKRAIIEGKYFTPEDLEEREIKKKGYKLYERIGQYRIEKIALNEVVLNDPEGNPFKFYLKKSMTEGKEILDRPSELKGKNLLGTAVK